MKESSVNTNCLEQVLLIYHICYENNPNIVHFIITMAPDPAQTFKRVGIIGTGNMGTMMAFGFAEQGLDVSLWDVSCKNIDQALYMAEKAREQERHLIGKVDCFRDIKDFTESLNDIKPAVYIFSITYGHSADSVLVKIMDDLREGDIILDGGNEHYRSTERRQKQLEGQKVHWVGMGVSGGYQSAQRGPSLSLGGSREAVETVLPLLEKFSAKDLKSGKPCVSYIGPKGAGHYVRNSSS